MTAGPTSYPVTFEADPPAPQSRLTVFFRLILVIPHAIILYFLGLAQGIITFLAWFVILFTGRYPAGLANFSVGVSRWSARVNAYQYLLTGQYPPFSMDEETGYPTRLVIEPQIEGRNRLTTFFRIILVIPHIIVLYILSIAAFVVVVIAWFAALFTASVPPGLHNFLAGYTRWSVRVGAYGMLLVDDYPPFSLS